jgi:hypothetical protein
MATIEISNATPTKGGLLRLTFTLDMGNSRLIMSGFRYDPEGDELHPPTFIGRRGGHLATVEAHGELYTKMLEMARDAYREQSDARE